MWSVLAPYVAPGGGAAALLGVFWMVMTGRLIPVRVHERIIAAQLSEIAGKKREIDRLNTALSKAEKQRDELMELARTTSAIVAAIPRAGQASPAPDGIS